jgi:hypothetical protein
MRLSFTDTAIITVFGGMYMGVVSMGLALGGAMLIESVDNRINPRTPEYLANQKKKQLVSWIKGDHKRIQEKERVLDSLKKYKDSEHKNNTERDIKIEIEYLKRLLERWEHEKEVLDFAFCLEEEPAPLMPVEIGFRKMFFGL